jgi:hypothetical protein
MSTGPESRSLQGHFGEIRVAGSQVQARDGDLNQSVGRLSELVAQTAMTTQAVSATNAAVAVALQAGLAAVAELSARLQHQANELRREADDLETLVADHATRAGTFGDSIGFTGRTP